MCLKKKPNLSDDSAMELDSEDVSMSNDSDDSDSASSEQEAEGTAQGNVSASNEEVEEEEEDEVIRAIRRECERKNDHPPVINCDDFIMDISFHPFEDVLAVATVVGDVLFYKYSNEQNALQRTLEVHTKACRDIEFSLDGKTLLSTSKDKSIMLSDVETGRLLRFYEKSHEVAVYCLTVINENQFATGDDNGTVKIWDTRQKGDKPIYKTTKNEDFISDIITNEANKYLICSSGDGSLTTIDMEKMGVHMQSEEYNEELTCLGLFRNESKVLAGSSKGKLFLFNWNEFGLHSDAFPGPKVSINAMIPITENIVITACDDGNLRATHLFPHRHLGVAGQHDMSVENLDICNDGSVIASSGHNNEIKFWNVKYFEDFEKLSHKQKRHERKKELANNLPSSKVKNASDFFSDLA